MMKILIIIWAVSSVITIINFIIGRKKLLKMLQEPQFIYMKGIFSEVFKSASVTRLKKAIFNPYNYFICGLVVFIISPFLVPITLWSLIKKIFKIKTKLDKQIEQEKNALKKEEDIEHNFIGSGILNLDEGTKPSAFFSNIGIKDE